MTSENHALRNWVDQQWPNLKLNDFTVKAEFQSAKDAAPSWQALHGDAGFRRYFRLASEPSLLAVYAPPATEDSAQFIALARHLRKHGVLAPAIASADVERGYLLIEDFGPDLLLSALQDNTVDALYAAALESLMHLQSVPTDSLQLPIYDRTRLQAEMGLFPEWFVERLLQHSLSIVEQQMLEAWFAELTHSALSQPQVFVHRDFHSRNLVLRNGGPPGVIDFQDAVVGPITYDLVSLLRDCYVSWPTHRVRGWATDYATSAIDTGLMDPVSEQTFLRWFDFMGLQRHIKVLGIFARLSLRDQKHNYLHDLSLVLAYTLSVARQYPEAKDFVEWFEATLLPKIKQHSWYREVSLG